MRTLSLHLASQTGCQKGLVMSAMGTEWVAGMQRGESPGNNELWKDCDPRKGALGLYRLSCCCSIAKLCPTLCDPMDYSTPGFPVFHYLLEFAQTHVH